MKWRITPQIAGMQKYWPRMDGLKLSDVLIDQHLIWETILTLQASIYSIYSALFIVKLYYEIFIPLYLNFIGIKLCAEKKLPEPRVVNVVEIVPNKVYR